MSSATDMQTKPSNERRAAPRVHAMTHVTLQYAAGTTDATTLDLSACGVAVWTAAAPPPGEVHVTFDLDGARIRARATVARTFRGDGGSLWGLVFTGLDPLTRTRIRQYVNRHVVARAG